MHNANIFEKTPEQSARNLNLQGQLFRIKKSTYLNYKNKKFRKYMRKFLTYLEPRYFNEGDTIQEQNEEVYEVTFIMKGKAGVGYRLFN